MIPIHLARRFPRVALAALAFSASAGAQVSISRVSVDSNEHEGSSYSSYARVAASGRWVVFGTSSPLAPSDAGYNDIYLRDLAGGATYHVSQSAAGGPANGWSYISDVSDDGRFVVFTSDATNLVVPATNGFDQCFVRDRAANTTVLVSKNASGVQGLGHSKWPEITPDGRYVAFVSLSPNLITPDLNSTIEDVYLRDMVAGTLERVNLRWDGTQGGQVGGWATISDDGRFVTFDASDAYVANDTNFATDVFVRDRVLGATRLVSVSSNGGQGNSVSFGGSISGDGRYVAFASLADNLVPNHIGGALDVFVHDLATGATELASPGVGGQLGNAGSYDPRLSADGRFVVFESVASNLVAGDTNAVSDVFRFDRWTRAMVRIPVRPTGVQSWRRSFTGDVSADGRWVTFGSSSPKLVPDDTNDVEDVFVRDMLVEPAASYCTAKTDSQGCVPAIAAAGAASLTSTAVFEISAEPVLNQRTGVLLWSSDPAATPAFGGTRCVAAPFRRSPAAWSGGTTSGSDCSGRLALDFNVLLQGPAGASAYLGETLFAQWLYRDPSDPSGGVGMSDALAFVVNP